MIFTNSCSSAALWGLWRGLNIAREVIFIDLWKGEKSSKMSEDIFVNNISLTLNLKGIAKQHIATFSEHHFNHLHLRILNWLEF